MRPIRCDIFCRVIDNYGDIGVCWRLARRLAEGHGWQIRLWVDDLAALGRVTAWAGLQPIVDGIEIVSWAEPVPELEPGDVVIEAFACDPPARFVQRMGANQVWLNLEYLSAEPWVEGVHGLPSPQGGGRSKHFFFPGFTHKTGGLLREPDLIARRDAFQADAGAIAAYLCSIGFPTSMAQSVATGERQLVTLFCYRDAPVQALVNALRSRGTPSLLALTGGVMPGLEMTADAGLPMVRVPFLAQADYDPLLWAASLNAVRGEDSFVRAQWAGRPMLWNIYPQDDGAHLDKLDAWLQLAEFDESGQNTQKAWNAPLGARTEATLAAWLAPEHQEAARQHAHAWARQLSRGPELADALANFCANRLKS